MSYITQQQLIDRFGEPELIQLTDRAGSVGAIVTTVLDGAIADADGTIDAHLAGRYLPPLASVPRSLQRIAADLVRYHLYDSAAPDDIRIRYDDALKFLRAAASGAIHLGVDALGLPATPAAGAEMQSGGRTFGRDDPSFI